MTIEEALINLQFIEDNKGDDEAAHASEDHFHMKVLKAIAEGSPDAVELAKIAIKTDDIEFARWCA